MLCQRVRKSSLPGKAGGFRGGQDTVERHAGVDVVMEKIDQWEQAIPSRERETGAAGVMEGPGESSPRSGVRRGGAPRQTQCITLGRLAPRHFALRRRSRCPRLRTARRRAAREGCRWRERPFLSAGAPPEGVAFGRSTSTPSSARRASSSLVKSLATIFKARSDRDCLYQSLRQRTCRSRRKSVKL